VGTLLWVSRYGGHNHLSPLLEPLCLLPEDWKRHIPPLLVQDLKLYQKIVPDGLIMLWGLLRYRKWPVLPHHEPKLSSENEVISQAIEHVAGLARNHQPLELEWLLGLYPHLR